MPYFDIRRHLNFKDEQNEAYCDATVIINLHEPKIRGSFQVNRQAANGNICICIPVMLHKLHVVHTIPTIQSLISLNSCHKYEVHTQLYN